MSEESLPYRYWNQDEQSKIENNTKYHPPIGDQHIRYETMRLEAKKLMQAILGHCPPSRERSLAFTKIEEAMMWANASIARNETENQGEN